jgi:hypothetical protein
MHRGGQSHQACSVRGLCGAKYDRRRRLRSCAFGVEVGELRLHPGGFEADGFTDGRWFVKLWRQQPDSDAALALTAELAARGIPVPAAQRALDG